MIEASSEGGIEELTVTGRSMERTAAMSSPPEAAPTRAVSPEAGAVEAPPVRGVGARGGASDSESKGECGVPRGGIGGARRPQMVKSCRPAAARRPCVDAIADRCRRV